MRESERSAAIKARLKACGTALTPSGFPDYDSSLISRPPPGRKVSAKRTPRYSSIGAHHRSDQGNPYRLCRKFGRRQFHLPEPECRIDLRMRKVHRSRTSSTKVRGRSLAGVFLLCARHEARFGIRTGHCTAGPCEGAQLQSYPTAVVDGKVCISGIELTSLGDRPARIAVTS
jgi:hypothetical protein